MREDFVISLSPFPPHVVSEWGVLVVKYASITPSSERKSEKGRFPYSVVSAEFICNSSNSLLCEALFYR